NMYPRIIRFDGLSAVTYTSLRDGSIRQVVWSKEFGFAGDARRSTFLPPNVGAIGQVKSLAEGSRIGREAGAAGRVWARLAGISTTVTPGSRNGEPMVACSPQFTGRSNPSRFCSSFCT